jgi:hypothetical protein
MMGEQGREASRNLFRLWRGVLAAGEAEMTNFRITIASMILALAVGLASSPAALADDTPPSAAKADDNPGLRAATEKFNAYVEFLNRTLRASESLERYKSWVNMTTGPTGRERIIYGLYSVL